MSWIPKLGDRVHCIFGDAIIIDIQRNKVVIKILSGDHEKQILAFPIGVFLSKVEPISPEETPNSEISAILRNESKSDRIKQMKCIDALRFGLVPYDYIKELTLGFNSLEDWVMNSLPNSNEENCQIAHNIIGDYGEGKSHTMGVIRYIALREGYLVGNVEVDGKSVSLSDPKTFLYMLMTSLKAKDLPPAMPLLNLYLKAIHSKNYHLSDDISIAPYGIDRVQRMCKLIELLDMHDLIDDCGYLIDIILTCSDEMNAGEVKIDLIDQADGVVEPYTKVNPMVGSPVAERPFDFIESLIGTTDIAQRADYKGFIITIDEMEVESRNLNKVQYERTINLFNVLLAYFRGHTDHLNVPLGIYFASVFEDRNKIPEEVLNKIKEMVDVSKGSIKEIYHFEGWNPNNNQQVALVKRIHQIYKEAYECDGYSDNEILNNLEAALGNTVIGESGGIRSFIKQYVSYLDSIYGPPKVGLV